MLTSVIGEKGLRDPFVIRSPKGDRFDLIATDLRMYRDSSGSWDQVQRHGSRSVMVWESADLVHWTGQRLVRVAPDNAGNTWAPNRMLYATTTDFRAFSEPKVWDDPGHSVIDSTVIKDKGTYYRFTKDERDPSSGSPCSKFITAEKARDLTDTSYDFVADCVGSGALQPGEGPTVFRSDNEKKWYLFTDEYGLRGYVPFETTALASGTWTPSTDYALPAGPRHGTVLPVTGAEYERLLRTYGQVS